MGSRKAVIWDCDAPRCDSTSIPTDGDPPIGYSGSFDFCETGFAMKGIIWYACKESHVAPAICAATQRRHEKDWSG